MYLYEYHYEQNLNHHVVEKSQTLFWAVASRGEWIKLKISIICYASLLKLVLIILTK